MRLFSLKTWHFFFMFTAKSQLIIFKFLKSPKLKLNSTGLFKIHLTILANKIPQVKTTEIQSRKVFQVLVGI